MIDPDVKFGKNVVILNENLVNIYGCEIGDDSFVGPFVEITRGVSIGRNCKIMSHSFICTDVIIEDNVFIAHGVMFTNDLYPRTDRFVEYAKTLVKKGASVGTNSTIIGGVTIGEGSVIGAGAVITKDVPDFSIVAGNPAKILKIFQNQQELSDYITKRQPASAQSQSGYAAFKLINPEP